MELLYNDNYFKDGYELIDPIQSIQVIALYPFDEQYPADSVVTDCFKGFQTDGEEAKFSYWGIDLSIVYILHNPYLYLALMKETEKGKHQFQVQLTMKSGKILTHQTSPIVFL